MFHCEDVEDFNEYIGCKLKRHLEKRTLTFTQLVLLQSFEDKFELADRNYETSAEVSSVLQTCSNVINPTAKDLKTLKSGMRKLFLLTR